MTRKPTILAFAGSTRRDSLNHRLAAAAAAAAEDAGAAVTLIRLRDFPLPLYDADLEQAHGLPQEARRLQEMAGTHQGFLIAAPEYNGSITGVLKNAIDWMSRPAGGEANIASFRDKAAALLSASPGALGGMRGLSQTRSVLTNLGVLVLPAQVSIPRAHEAFGETNALRDPEQQSKVAALAASLADVLRRLHRNPA